MANDISTTFNDRQMFTTQPNWGKDITSSIALERRILKQIGGVKTISELNTDAPITLMGDLTLFDRETIYNLLDFFNNRNGRTESFWFLHPSRFFTLKQAYTSGNTYIVVNRNYGEKWTQGLDSQYDWGIYIYMNNGDLICRKVTGITDNGDASRIYLDETIPRNITADNYLIIGRTLVGRFDQNQLSINFSAQGVGTTPLQLKENYREYETWSPVDGTRQWLVKDQVSGTHMASPTSYGSPTGGGTIINSWYSYPFMYIISQDYWYHIMIRFFNVDIPNGVTVKSCTLTFVVDDSSPYRGIDYDLSFANYDNVQTLSSDTSSFLNLDRTPTVRWQVDTGVSWELIGRVETVNIAEALQTIVDRPGWESGNSLMFCGNCRLTNYGMRTKQWYSGHSEGGRIRLKAEWV